jgi:uncharacterized glyoxalase superfamily protein PhnB
VPNHSCFLQVRIEYALTKCERARQAGATVLTKPADHPYGQRQYDAQDFLSPKRFAT